MTLRRANNYIMLTLCGLAATLALLVLGLVLFFLMSKGFHSLRWTLFTRVPDAVTPAKGGIAQSITGTLTLLGLAAVVGLPLGILGGIYQVEARGRFASLVRFFTDVLNGIPSIVIGIFVYAVWVLPTAERIHRSGQSGSAFSAYAGGFALGIMMVPTVMRTTEEILRLVPFAMREASLGLGATRWRTMWSVVLPAARGHVLGHKFNVATLNAPIDAMPLRIYNYATAVDPAQQNMAWAGAVVLIGFILILSIAARFATRSRFLEEK